MNLFAACRTNHGLVPKRVVLTHDVQQGLENLFAHQEQDFRDKYNNEVPFDGSWKPDEDEILTIEVPADATFFEDTIAGNPLAVEALDTGNFEFENIRALFTGQSDNGEVSVLIQRFSPTQILTRRFALLLHDNAFKQIDSSAFALDNKLLAIIEGGQMKFSSFHNLRSVVDLSEYYREATDADLDDFANHASLNVEDIEQLKSAADQTTRKLIHAISRSGVLDEHTPEDIQTAAGNVGIEMQIVDGRIDLPEERAEIKKLLRFLDDGLYEAPLSQQRYITNSKRRI